MGSHWSTAQDPNFHIYLCFGQSNMEGQGTIESQDQNVDSRFRILQAVNCSGKPQETWRTATPPLARCNTNLGPADYFGREMVKNLPSHIRVGVVHVAVAGCKIELFDKVNYASYAGGVEQWMKDIIAQYGGNPYARLVQLAKIAQKDGVIKGILLHQGESNNEDREWPNKVKGVYQNLLNDLGLSAADVPLLVGQVVDAAQGGLCAAHNNIINTIGNTIPTAHVISSSGCTAVSDRLHFTSAGYRLLGTRYAQKMLTLLPPLEDTPPSITANLNDVTVAENQTLTLTIGANGSDLSYVWYRNDQVIAGATSATLTIPNIDASYDKSTFKVVVSNNLGSVTSNSITLTVADFLGVKIVRTEHPVIIDGIEDPVWSHSNSYLLKNKLMTVDNDADLSGKVNLLYDNQNLYVLYTITDNIKRASSNNFWENDGVELYIDGNNDKATSYDANDFQFVIQYDASQIQEGHSKSVTGIVAKATESTTGYVVEVAVPWSLIGVSPSEKKIIGLDFHVNDSDLSLRDGKITWFATEDISYSNPSAFGLGRLESQVVTSLPKANQETIALYPNPAKASIRIEGVPSQFAYSIMDYSGREVVSGTSGNDITVESLPSGFYSICIQEGSKRTVMKFIKE